MASRRREVLAEFLRWVLRNCEAALPGSLSDPGNQFHGGWPEYFRTA